MTSAWNESEADSRYRQRVRELDAFGHRGSATQHEHRAAEYLLAQLQNAGIEAHLEPFRGSRSMAVRFLIHVVLAALAIPITYRAPLISELWLLIVLASFIAEQMTLGVWLSWFACRFKSYNVVGRVPASGTPRLRLVVCAHYDTQKSGWIWDVARWLLPIQGRSPLFFKQPLWIVMALMAVQLLASALGPKFYIMNRLVLLGYVVVAILLVQWACSAFVPGAADNASGVAAAMEIGEQWQQHPLADVELLVLLPGCEESGLLGSSRWATRHAAEVQSLPTAIVNIDGIGFGPPRFLGAEVPAAGLPLRVPVHLLKILESVAQERRLENAGPHSLPGPTDTLSFLAHGMAAVSIVGFREGYHLPHYHTAMDCSANIDFSAAKSGTAFAAAVVRRLAEPH